MTLSCEISKKLLKIKVTDDKVGYASEILKKTHPYAEDYLKQFKGTLQAIKNTDTLSPADVKSMLDKSRKHLFFKWLNNAPNFITSKQRLIKENFIQKNTEQVQALLPYDHLKQDGLEFACANVICMCVENIRHLSDVISVPKKWRNFVKQYESELLTMSRNFELESEEQLFLYLVRRLKSSKGSVYNSGTSHSLQMREFLIKKIMQMLFSIYGKEKKNCTLIVTDLALNISAIFFDSGMKRGDAIKHAKVIELDVIRAEQFLEKKVKDLLFENN